MRQILPVIFFPAVIGVASAVYAQEALKGEVARWTKHREKLASN
jgi:hypothetical protein